MVELNYCFNLNKGKLNCFYYVINKEVNNKTGQDGCTFYNFLH